jgi:hypothetical protein
LSSALLDTDTRVRENSQSAFVEYSRTFGKIQAQLGLRYERVGFDYYEDEVKQEAQCRTFRNLFPSFMLSGSFGVHQVQLGYRRDIARPSYRSLSTSVLYGNRYTLETGNPLLLPTLTDDINAVWSWRWVQVYADFQHIQDDVIKMFLNYQEEVKDESAISESTGIITPQNIRSYNVTNLSVSLSPTLGIWTPVLTTGLRRVTLTYKFNAARSKYRGTGAGESQKNRM